MKTLKKMKFTKLIALGAGVLSLLPVHKNLQLHTSYPKTIW